VDNWSAFPSASREMALELEAETTRKADVVFATSRPLAKRLEGLNANVHYLPNAADTELFEKTMDSGTEVAEEMREIKKPVAGFVGTLDGWFDSELVRKAARLRRDWSFVIVGTKFPEFKDDALLKEENVHYLGLKPRNTLPSYIKGMDACIIPFAINELTLSVSPLKLYEYIAAGKPVVSTRMPEVESVGALARVADTPEQFVTALDACLKDNTDKQLAERRKFASLNTWDARVETLSGWIQNALKGRKAR
jgi:glycosyltransferase involved in cell wall biosynthesis